MAVQNGYPERKALPLTRAAARMALMAWACIAGVLLLAPTAIAEQPTSIASNPAAPPSEAPKPDSPKLTTTRRLPAVDGVNGKVAALGGVANSRAFYGGAGSITIPLGLRFGLQVDAVVAGLDSKYQGGLIIGGGALHLFWRDPKIGLAGIYGHYLHSSAFDGVDSYAAGAQGALYLGRFTVEGVLGVQGGRAHLTSSFRGTLKTRFFDIVQVAYYPTDNLRLSLGHSYLFGTNSAVFGFEWGFPVGGKTLGALFVGGSVAQNGSGSVMTGVRFYFGRGAKPLIRRHREDDPTAYLNTGSYNIGFANTGNMNTGYFNSGDYNNGTFYSGNGNFGPGFP